MFSLLLVLLSILVLILSGAVVILGFQLRAAKKSRREAVFSPIQNENTGIAILRQKREKAARLCMDIKRSLTHIHTTIPTAIPGLSIERVRLLCADELKDKVTAVSNIFGKGFPDQFVSVMNKQDLALLDKHLNQLTSIAKDVKQIDFTLTTVLKTWSDSSTAAFDDYEARLTAISRRMNELHKAVSSLVSLIAEKSGAGEAVPSVQQRIRQASMEVTAPKVRASMADLEMLVQKHYDDLDGQTKVRIESYYLETLELVLGELGRAEQAGEDTQTREELSIRVIHVLSDIFSAGQQVQREISERNLAAEVAALERLAAMRGDVSPEKK